MKWIRWLFDGIYKFVCILNVSQILYFYGIDKSDFKPIPNVFGDNLEDVSVYKFVYAIKSFLFIKFYRTSHIS